MDIGAGQDAKDRRPAGRVAAAVRALALTVTTLLAATVASAQPATPVTPGAFQVSFKMEEDPVASRLVANVHNSSVFRVTNALFQVCGVAADGRGVGCIDEYAIGDIPAGGDSSFLFEAMPDAVRYETRVVSYDIVAGPVVPRPY